MKYDKQRVDYLLTQPRTADNVNELIALNYGLIDKQLRKFHMYNDPDALSIAYEALSNAINTFDAKSSKLSTYATVCIYNRLGSYVRSLKSQPEAPILYEKPISQGLRLVDVLEHPEQVDSAMRLKEIRVAIGKCYFSLTNNLHRRIVVTWIQSEFTMTTTEIGKRVGCSQVYASTVLKQFKTKLEAMLNEST